MTGLKGIYIRFFFFHNNIRSANKNLINVEEIFRNCQFFPDIIGVTETKLIVQSLRGKKDKILHFEVTRLKF